MLHPGRDHLGRQASSVGGTSLKDAEKRKALCATGLTVDLDPDEAGGVDCDVEAREGPGGPGAELLLLLNCGGIVAGEVEDAARSGGRTCAGGDAGSLIGARDGAGPETDTY